MNFITYYYLDPFCVNIYVCTRMYVYYIGIYKYIMMYDLPMYVSHQTPVYQLACLFDFFVVPK